MPGLKADSTSRTSSTSPATTSTNARRVSERSAASAAKAGLQISIYWSSACPGCSMKAQCTTGEYRRIRRWEHEEVLDLVQQRLDQMSNAMTVRKSTIEHVFGTLRHWMGWTHFLTRGIENVATEMSLSMLAYNFKRVLSVLGFERTRKAMLVGGKGALCGCCGSPQQPQTGSSIASGVSDGAVRTNRQSCERRVTCTGSARFLKQPRCLAGVHSVGKRMSSTSFRLYLVRTTALTQGLFPPLRGLLERLPLREFRLNAVDRTALSSPRPGFSSSIMFRATRSEISCAASSHDQFFGILAISVSRNTKSTRCSNVSRAAVILASS